MAATKGIVYTTIFKLYHVAIDSKRIDLAKDTWIASDSQNKGQPENALPSMLMFRDPQDLDPLRFYQSLLDSKVVIGTRVLGEDSDKRPFDLHNCSYIAIAISILSDYFFAAGIESFSNNKDVTPPTLGPWVSLFMGKKEKQVVITSSDESRLKSIYDFVFQSLKASSYDSAKAKLLFLYLKCVVRSPSQSFHVLKMGIEPLLNERSTVIVNAALFFEHVFTRESRRQKEGVKRWNNSFGSAYCVEQEDVDVIMNYRHTLVHDNATEAKNYISDWKGRHSLSDEEAFEKAEGTAIATVRNCIRAIVEDYGKYQSYRAALP